MRPSQASRARALGVLTLTCLIAAVLVGAVVFDVTRRAARMQTAKTSAAAVIQAPPGAVIKAVVRVQGVDQGNVYLAEILESVDGTTYRETPNHIHVVLTPETELVMGSGADVKLGAVVQVAGTIDRERTIRAARIVILSGYIRVAG